MAMFNQPTMAYTQPGRRQMFFGMVSLTRLHSIRGLPMEKKKGCYCFTLAVSAACVSCSSCFSSCVILSLSDVIWSSVFLISFSMSCSSSFSWSVSYIIAASPFVNQPYYQWRTRDKKDTWPVRNTTQDIPFASSQCLRLWYSHICAEKGC